MGLWGPKEEVLVMGVVVGGECLVEVGRWSDMAAGVCCRMKAAILL